MSTAVMSFPGSFWGFSENMLVHTHGRFQGWLVVGRLFTAGRFCYTRSEQTEQFHKALVGDLIQKEFVKSTNLL